MSVFRRKRIAEDGKKVSSGKWTVQFTDASGIVRRLPGFTDKSATLELERGILRLVFRLLGESRICYLESLGQNFESE